MSETPDKLSVTLEGKGAHRRLALTLPPAQRVCKQLTGADLVGQLRIQFAIPPALMFDPYQLETSLPSEVTFKLHGDLDLELCVPSSRTRNVARASVHKQ
jgi:hypothetical protein